jgi:damage-control phosphatase, subfamily I
VRTRLDCVPCLVRQAVDAARMASDDPVVHEAVLRRVLRELSVFDLSASAPAMARRIHRTVRELSGEPDPYRAVKERTNELALELMPEVRERVAAAADPLEMAVRMAIAGNIIDFGLGRPIADTTLVETVDRVATATLAGDMSGFAREAAEARSILYLADNAGEIVLDRLLIERLGPQRVTVAVKGAPILNDALRADAEAAGLDALVEVVDTGSDAPGTILETCSESFRERFAAADLVIAKGQGNYETLSDAPRPIWFVLMAKCAVIADHMGCEPGTLVLLRRPATGAPRSLDGS